MGLVEGKFLMKSRFMSNDEKTEIISLHEKGFNTVEIGKKDIKNVNPIC